MAKGDFDKIDNQSCNDIDRTTRTINPYSETKSNQSLLNNTPSDGYLMVLNLPKILKSVNDDSSRGCDAVCLETLSFHVRGNVVPSTTVPSKEISTAGFVYKTSSSKKQPYEPINVEFTVDSQYNNYWLLWKWLNYFITGSCVNNRQASENAKLTTDIVAYGLNEYKCPVIKFTYKDAFITSLGSLTYNDVDSGDLIGSFTYDFSDLLIDLVDPNSEDIITYGK